MNIVGKTKTEIHWKCHRCEKIQIYSRDCYQEMAWKHLTSHCPMVSHNEHHRDFLSTLTQSDLMKIVLSNARNRDLPLFELLEKTASKP